VNGLLMILVVLAVGPLTLGVLFGVIWVVSVMRGRGSLREAPSMAAGVGSVWAGTTRYVVGGALAVLALPLFLLLALATMLLGFGGGVLNTLLGRGRLW
jgi:hypothetical protein